MAVKGNKTSGRMIGIEAGGEWLKIAVIEGCGGSPVFSKLHISRVEGGLDGLGSVFPAVWQKFKGVRGRIVYFLPRHLVTVRVIDLPSVDPAEIHDMVELQVGKQTPYNREEIVFDYKPIAGAREGYTTVFLAIVQRSVVRQVFYAFEEAGIDVGRVCLSTEAVAGWASRGIKDGACRVVLDIDSGFSDIIVMRGHDIVFNRSVLVGAESLQQGQGADRLLKDLHSTIEVYRTERAGGAVGSVIVSGADGAGDAVAAAIREAGLKCEVRSASASLKSQPKSDAGSMQGMSSVSLSCLIGLGSAPGALSMNMMPDSVSVRRALAAKARSLAALGILVMSILVSVSVFANIRAFTRLDVLKSMKSELAAGSDRVVDVDRMMSIVRRISERKNPGLSCLAALNELRGAVSVSGGDIRVSGIEIDNAAGSFNMEGMAESTGEIRALVKALEQCEFFCDVRESGTVRDQVSRKYKFQVSGKMEAVK